MVLTAAAVAALVGGRLEGDESVEVCAVGPLDRAHGGALSFLTSAKYAAEFAVSRAGVVLVPLGFHPPATGPTTRIAVSDPQRAMAVAVRAMFPASPPAPGIHPTASLGRGVRVALTAWVGPQVVLGAGVELGENVSIGAGAVLEDGVLVGSDSVLEARVVCHPGVSIGERVVVKAGAVLGGVGFGFVSDRGGHQPVPHVGRCRIGNDVQIGANSCIDRGSVDDTVIGDGCKIDNLVHIGHNSRLGKRCLVMGGVVVAGSARIGDDVILAGHSAVGGHFSVGDRARIGAKAGVISEVAAGADVSGFPARPHRDFLRAQAALYRLAPIIDELESLVHDRS